MPAGLPVAGIGSQLKTSTMTPSVIAYVAAGCSRRNGAMARRVATNAAVGPVSHAAAARITPTKMQAPATSRSMLVPIATVASIVGRSDASAVSDAGIWDS